MKWTTAIRAGCHVDRMDVRVMSALSCYCSTHLLIVRKSLGWWSLVNVKDFDRLLASRLLLEFLLPTSWPSVMLRHYLSWTRPPIMSVIFYYRWIRGKAGSVGAYGIDCLGHDAERWLNIENGSRQARTSYRALARSRERISGIDF